MSIGDYWSSPHDVAVFTAIVESSDHDKAPVVLCHGCGEVDHSNRLPNKEEHEVPYVVSTVVECVLSYDPDGDSIAHEGRTLTEATVVCGVDMTWPGFSCFAGSCDLCIGYCFRVVA